MKREKILENIVKLLKNYGANKVVLFGSYVRRKEKPESDIDIIVEFSERKSLFDIVGIE